MAQLGFELLISEISSALINIPPEEVDSTLLKSLQRILDCLEIDRVSLWQQEDPAVEKLTLTHLRVRPGCGPAQMPVLTTDSFPWMIRQYLQGLETKYSRIDDLPEEAAVDKANLRQFGPQYSALAVPLFQGARMFGILGLGIAKEMIWPEELSSRLRVVALVFAGALQRKKTEEKLRHTLEELHQLKTRLEQENVYLRNEMAIQYSPSKIVYKSKVMAEVLSNARQVASTNATVILSGETGTGKEMVAAAIHAWSARAGRAMVRVNCGAIPAALIESELFGREKGAYTGALTRQIGRFELAHGSTIFLDEITELPLEVQVKLLRVLQEREFERLGSPKSISVDVRVIAASNMTLEKAVKEGKFREDLYYRLNVFPIDVPPLRMRREDIPLLVWSFVDELSAGKKVESIDASSMEHLVNYSWPGNVRELRNTIERSMILLKSSNLTVEPPSHTSFLSTDLSLQEIETQHIRKVLESTSWKIRGKNGAAEILKLKPTTLETRMAKLGIVRPKEKE